MTNLDKKLKEIRDRAEKATIGKWEYHMLGGGKGGPNSYDVRIALQNNSSAEFAICRCYSTNRNAGHNATFIAASRTDVPRLVEALEFAIKFLKTYGGYGDDAIKNIERTLDGKKEKSE